MSKNDIIMNHMIELDCIVDSVIGFRNLIPEGGEDHCFNAFVRSSLEKVEKDLKEVIKNVCNSL